MRHIRGARAKRANRSGRRITPRVSRPSGMKNRSHRVRSYHRKSYTYIGANGKVIRVPSAHVKGYRTRRVPAPDKVERNLRKTLPKRSQQVKMNPRRLSIKRLK